MALTGAERLTVDGTDLKTLAKNVETLAATLVTSGRRGANAVTAGRNGTVFTPNKPLEATSMVWPMWVLGCDDDGVIPGGSTARREFFSRIDELTYLFSGSSIAPLLVQHTLPDGSIRETNCEVLQAINFATDGWDPIGKFSVELQNLRGMWRENVDSTGSIINSYDTTTTIFSGNVTAPMDDARYVFTGPITNPRVLDVVTGATCQYNGTVAAGQTLTIDALNWTISATGFTPLMANLVFTGSGGRLMRLVPGGGRRYYAQLKGTATTIATRLDITGRRKFLVG